MLAKWGALQDDSFRSDDEQQKEKKNPYEGKHSNQVHKKAHFLLLS